MSASASLTLQEKLDNRINDLKQAVRDKKSEAAISSLQGIASLVRELSEYYRLMPISSVREVEEIMSSLVQSGDMHFLQAITPPCRWFETQYRDCGSAYSYRNDGYFFAAMQFQLAAKYNKVSLLKHYIDVYRPDSQTLERTFKITAYQPNPNPEILGILLQINPVNNDYVYDPKLFISQFTWIKSSTAKEIPDETVRTCLQTCYWGERFSGYPDSKIITDFPLLLKVSEKVIGDGEKTETYKKINAGRDVYPIAEAMLDKMLDEAKAEAKQVENYFETRLAPKPKKYFYLLYRARQFKQASAEIKEERFRQLISAMDAIHPDDSAVIPESLMNEALSYFKNNEKHLLQQAKRDVARKLPASPFYHYSQTIKLAELDSKDMLRAYQVAISSNFVKHAITAEIHDQAAQIQAQQKFIDEKKSREKQVANGSCRLRFSIKHLTNEKPNVETSTQQSVVKVSTAGR